MGWAWVLAAGVVAWAVWRRSVTAPAALLWLAPGVFLVCALLSAHVSGPSARFTLEGLAFPHSSEPQSTPLLLLGAAPSERAVIPTLALPGLPTGGVPVELFATPPQDERGTTRPARLELRVPVGSRAMIGFAREDDAFPFSNLVKLHDGETLVICPGGRGECAERVLAVERSPAGGLKIGPCDLSGEPRQLGQPATWGHPPQRTLALLDLYHYEAGRCVPRRVDEATPFWARRDGRGGWYLPLRSFLLLRGSDVRLALLDPPESLELRGRRQEAQAGLTAEGPGPHRLELLAPRVDVPFEVPCQEQDEAAARGDLSGGALCKRVRIFLRRPALELSVARERLIVAPLEPPSITVDAVCDKLTGCALGDLQAAYFKDASLKEVTPNVPLLWFGLSATGGEPIAAHLRFESVARECGELGAPCLVVGTRDGAYVHASDGRLAIGSPDGEQVFLRVTRVGVPWWLPGLLLGLLLVQLAVLAPRAPSRSFAALAAVVLVLLAARALFSFKLLARHPHDPEGLAGTLLGWAVLPVALVLAGHALERAGAQRAALALALGVATAVGLASFGVVTLSARLFASLTAGFGLLLALCAGLAWSGSRAWERLGERPEARRWGVLLAALVALRLLLAWVGFERLRDVPVIAWYWPAAIILLTLVARRLASTAVVRVPRLGWKVPAWAAFGLLGVIVVGVQAPGRGDAGSALVLGPPLLLAMLFVWGERVALGGRGRWLAPAALVLLACVGFFMARHLLDRSYPRVAAERAWSVRDAEHKGQGYLCPLNDDTQTGAALELGPSQEEVFRRGNLAVRRDDFVLRGAANRAGTKVGAEVHEFMAVLRRYAAGPSDAVGGAGYLSADVRRYGSGEVRAQLADGAPSLLLAAEGGTAAVFGLLALHALLLQALMRRHAELLPRLRGPDAALSFAALACAGVPAWTTLLMAGGNFGLLPFTGQSTPLLAVFSGMDLVVAPTLWALALGATRLAEECASTTPCDADAEGAHAR